MGFDVKSALAAVLVLVCASHALAAPSGAERETARSLMVEGDRLRSAGDLKGALGCFQAAHAIMHVPTTGLPMAEVLAELGLLVEARATALEITVQPAVSGEPAVFVTARRSAAALATKLEPRVCTLETAVTPTEANYTVQIDDTTLPNAARAVPFKLNPGAHVIRISARGYRTQTRELNLGEGESERLRFQLQPEPSKPAEAPVASHAEPADPAPASAVTPMADDSPADPGEAGRVRGFIALGVGGAALAAGIATGTWSWLATKHERDRCDGTVACDLAQSNLLARANTAANVANVTVPIGVLGIAYGLYELLTAPSSPPERAQSRLRFHITPQGALLRGEL